ncbi:hypothetical protein [Streptomyces sp. NPDC051921]|uniref:hypothetical protein n=1 Tax=Streptomyces sp. NPDC051921 TaxID=3155806 RepID=UPI0034334F38
MCSVILALTAAVAAALLVCRIALRERRSPGTARRALAFVHDRRALAAGVFVGLLLAALGWRVSGPGALAWAALAGALVAGLSTAAENGGPEDSEKRER